MRMKAFRATVTDVIITERLRCAAIAEKNGHLTTAQEILSARPPAFRIIKPETIQKKPELRNRQDLIVSGRTQNQIVGGEQPILQAPL